MIGVNSSTQTMLMSVPKNDEAFATKMAKPPLPCLASGCPSMAVAAEAGVPGMFSRMADWQPPEMAPMYTPTRISTASGPSMLYVRPVSSATPMVAVRPGSMPNTRPRPTDRISAMMP